jgi:dTDP-4-dehydrorhamnose 3,5-epimerase
MYARVHSVIVSELDLPGVKLLTPTLHQDHRGHFVELFTAAELEAAGIPSRFAQANVSHSLPRVLRGLHYQEDPSQGKLVSCIVGTIFDVVVDIDPESETFRQYVAVELDGTSRQSLWIPPRYAHGFFVMGSRETTVLYFVDTPRNPGTERGIAWDDPQLSINWPVQDPILSDRDRNHPLLNSL